MKVNVDIYKTTHSTAIIIVYLAFITRYGYKFSATLKLGTRIVV